MKTTHVNGRVQGGGQTIASRGGPRILFSLALISLSLVLVPLRRARKAAEV